jgi:hypothetical protein
MLCSSAQLQQALILALLCVCIEARGPGRRIHVEEELLHSDNGMEFDNAQQVGIPQVVSGAHSPLHFAGTG